MPHISIDTFYNDIPNFVLNYIKKISMKFKFEYPIPIYHMAIPAQS